MTNYDQFPGIDGRNHEPTPEPAGKFLRLGMAIGNLTFNLLERGGSESPLDAIRANQASHDAQMAAIDALVQRLPEAQQ